jgi:hypothetical protein
MKFTRGKRRALEVLGPPFLGAFLMTGFSIGEHLLRNGNLSFVFLQGRDYLLVFLYAYVFGILPSLAYMGVMEASFNRGLDPAGWRTVALSGGLGLLAGACIMLLISSGRASAGELAYFAGTGLVVGLLLGACIRRLSVVMDGDDSP